MKYKSYFTIALSVLILFYSSNVSYAYVREGWKLPTKTQSYKFGDRLTSTSVIKTGWTNAISSWKSSSANVNFFNNSSSVHILNSWYESSSTYYGRMTSYVNNKGIVTKFAGDINAGNTNITKTNVAKSTGVHELGHALGIAHNSGNSIMNSNRNRESMHVPQQDDVNGIKAIY